MNLDKTVRSVVVGLAGLALLIVAAVLWATWDQSFSLSVGWIVLTLAGIAGSFVVRYARADWSWALILTDPLGAVRWRAGRWLVALGTWMLARWLVPKLTARYLESGKLERLQGAAGG